MSRIIIESNPVENKIAYSPEILNVAEFFFETIQGEGFFSGFPAIFLRLQGCTLNCGWCDTQEVWRYGNPYSIGELIDLMQENGIFDMEPKPHLIITGGSPLKQQRMLLRFINELDKIYPFFIEIENECVLMPIDPLKQRIDCWNNSPKLKNSGNTFENRYKPDVIKTIASLQESWFKFVVSDEDDWFEIDRYFLQTGLVPKEKIILMPQGATREELIKNSPFVVELATKNNVCFSSREHIIIWDKKTGV